MRLIGVSFIAVAIYLAVQSTVVLALRFHPHHSRVGIAWTAATAIVMFALAKGKAHIGGKLGNAVLCAEGRITLIDAILATAVLCGLVLNALLGWWWADPAAAYVLLIFVMREALETFRH